MKARLYASTLVAAFAALATLSEAAFAKTLKDPCFVATAGVTQCDGENCAVDPKITLKGPWQRVANCLRPLRDRWAKDGAAETVNAGGKQVPVVDALRETIYRSMTQSNAGAALVADPGRYVPIETVLNPDLSLKQDVARIAQLNDRGQPYSSMSQTNIARTLFAFAALAKRGGYPEAEADRKNYDRLARAVVAAVLAPVSQGGLATTTPCAKAPDMTCTWFHAVTRKDIDTAQGGTLNKNLHAIRNLILIDRAAARTGGERDPALAAGAAAGLNQLFLAEGHDAAGKTPNLKDFLVDQDGDGPSWAYYGMNIAAAPPRGPYFLKTVDRNCGYHNHVLNLMATILDRGDDRQVDPKTRKLALACDSPLRRMYLASSLKAPPPANAPGVDDLWCSKRSTDVSPSANSFYVAAFKQCKASR